MFTPHFLSTAESRHISQHVSALVVSLRASTRNFVCRRRHPPSHPSLSNGFLEAGPKQLLACDILCPITFAAILTFMLSRLGTDQTAPWITHSQSCSGSLLAVVAVSATSAKSPTPFKTHHSQIICSNSLHLFTEVHRFNIITSDVLLLAELAQVGSRDRQVCRLPAQ